jgi:hypothetical protein
MVSLLAKRADELVPEEEWDDVPDEFLDPLLNSIMRDPVLLPSSRQICDRGVILRHLLSESTDPFNRQHLTEDMLISDIDLKQRIDAWIKEKRDSKRKEMEKDKGKEEVELSDKGDLPEEFCPNLDSSTMDFGDFGNPSIVSEQNGESESLSEENSI